MSYIRYEIDPNDPQKTESNRMKAYGTTFVGLILFFASLFCIVFLISSAIKMYSESYYDDFVIAGFWLLGMVVLDALPFIFITDNRKSFFVNICLCLILISGLLILTIGVAQLYNSNPLGALTICLSVILVLIYILLKILKHRKSNNMNTHFFKNKIDIADKNINEQKIQNNTPISRNLFCHKCGNKIPANSSFCSFCGASIPKEI